jgi:hypothetical protein
LFLQRGESLSSSFSMSTLITSDKTAFIKSFIFRTLAASIVSVEFRKLTAPSFFSSTPGHPRDERHWLRSQSA